MRVPPPLLACALLFTACAPDARNPDPAGPISVGPRAADPRPWQITPPTPECPLPVARSVLIDASHDGGVWWYPQTAPFDESAPHQGLAFARYLRDQGYAVRELGRGDTISTSGMITYPVVMRAGKYGPYTAADIALYQHYVACPRTLLLIGEFLRPGERDELADSLGVPLSGWVNGFVDTRAVTHTLTFDWDNLPYVAGSTLDAVHDSSITVLGWVGNAAVMGVRHHPPAQIFFLGDLNGIEQAPMSALVSNLMVWGF